MAARRKIHTFKSGLDADSKTCSVSCKISACLSAGATGESSLTQAPLLLLYTPELLVYMSCFMLGKCFKARTRLLAVCRYVSSYISESTCWFAVGARLRKTTSWFCRIVCNVSSSQRFRTIAWLATFCNSSIRSCVVVVAVITWPRFRQCWQRHFQHSHNQ